MVATRSQTVRTRLEDFATKAAASQSKGKQTEPADKPTPKANTSKKRKPTEADHTDEKPTTKRAKASPKKSTKTKDEPAGGDKEINPIIINRAPVLHLWAASVTHLTYPELSWETCLSAGAAVSAICAVAKGRSIGTVPEKEDSEASNEQAREKQKDLDEIEVMHFKLKIKNGLAAVGSEAKGKAGGEEALKGKFGEGEYEAVKGGFGTALRSWVGDEEELNRRAFRMYETFRPDVSKGQKGWGRKGELNLENVAEAVRKG